MPLIKLQSGGSGDGTGGWGAGEMEHFPQSMGAGSQTLSTHTKLSWKGILPLTLALSRQQKGIPRHIGSLAQLK